MPTISLNPALEYDIEDYVYGDTFNLMFAFYQDDAGLIPEDLTGWSFIMDIATPQNCGHFQPSIETLAIGSGITITGNDVIISKRLTSLANTYNQSVRYIKPDGTTITFESGVLIINSKV